MGKAPPSPPPPTTPSLAPTPETTQNTTNGEPVDDDTNSTGIDDATNDEGGVRNFRLLQDPPDPECKARYIFTGTRWYQVMQFAAKAGVKIVFSLNYNFHTRSDPCTKATRDTQDWDPTQARQFLEFTRAQAPNGVIYGFELGNEVTHKGRIKDLPRLGRAYGVLRDIVLEIWGDTEDRPLIMGPAGTLSESSSIVSYIKEYIDVVTFHKYHESGMDEELAANALNGYFYYSPSKYSDEVQQMGNFTRIWLGEGAMASNSGRAGVTDTFISTMWMANALGSMSKAQPVPISTFARQCLVGGNYGLLSSSTLDPYPDFYMMRLWKQLVGRQPVGPVEVSSTENVEKLLIHAFCGRTSGQLVFILINSDGDEQYSVSLPEGSSRETYVLEGTPHVNSKFMIINGESQIMNDLGKLPDFSPLLLPKGMPLDLPSYSVAFVVVNDSTVAICGGEPRPPSEEGEDGHGSDSRDIPFILDDMSNGAFGAIIAAMGIAAVLGMCLCHCRKRRHEILAQEDDGLMLQQTGPRLKIQLGNNDDELL